MCALKLLSPKTTPLTSMVRQQLEEYLREEILALELMDAHSQLTPGNIEKRCVCVCVCVYVSVGGCVRVCMCV